MNISPCIIVVILVIASMFLASPLLIAPASALPSSVKVGIIGGSTLTKTGACTSTDANRIVMGGCISLGNSAFSGFTFTPIPLPSFPPANLSALYDTLLLNVASPNLGCTTSSLNASQKAALVSFMTGGGKLIIYDSECAAGLGVDYTWLPSTLQFNTSNPGALASHGSAKVVENNTLASGNPLSPYYVNLTSFCQSTDACGDANVMLAKGTDLCNAFNATTGIGVTGPVHVYSRDDGGAGKGMLLYLGFDLDYSDSNLIPSPTGIGVFAKLLLQELKQPWNPNGLGCTAPIIKSSISLTKTPSTSKVENNTLVTYTYNVTNTGGTTLSAVNVTDSILGSIASGQTLVAGQSKIFKANATLTSTTTNIATAVGKDQFGAKVQAQAQANVTVIHPKIKITKIPSATLVENGTLVTYTFNVTNTGDTALSAVNVTDNKMGIIASGQTLAVGQSKIFTKNATLTANTANTATAVGIDQLKTKVSATTTVTVTVIHPAISLTKSCSPASQTAPGTITWNLTVKNTGDTALTVTLSGSLAGDIAGPITLLPGQSKTVTFSSSNLTAGTYRNNATANGIDQLNTKVTAKAIASCTVNSAPVTKSGRMTGGGSILPKNQLGRITHGFEIHCNPANEPNNLEVNWDKGNNFHLTSLTTAVCTNDRNVGGPNPPKAGFNTFTGTGTGRLNGVDNATIEFTFTDAGEPGRNDFAKYIIKDSSGNIVLQASGYLRYGNQQAHG